MTTNSFSNCLKKADQLGPLIEGDAAEAEKLTHMTDKVVAAMQEGGLYKLLWPRVLGGAQLPYAQAMEVIERLSYYDGASGWCAMVGNVTGGDVAAFLPDQGIQETYAKTPNLMLAGQGAPSGRARRVDGGYMISGNWNYGSGIYHADLIHSGCIVMDGDIPVMLPGGVPEIVLCHFPKKEVEIKHNWHVLGLKGTGSYDYCATDLFVPEHMCFSFTDHEPKRGGIQYSPGLVGVTAWGHTSWALGVVRRALDELAQLSTHKANAFGVMGDFPGFQEHYARAEAKYRAARAFCYEAWRDIDESFVRKEHATTKQIALVRLATRHIHDVGSEVTRFTHVRGGGVSLRDSVMQRCFRDMHAGTQHLVLSDQIMQGCGKVLSGRASKKAHWHILGLLED